MESFVRNYRKAFGFTIVFESYRKCRAIVRAKSRFFWFFTVTWVTVKNYRQGELWPEGENRIRLFPPEGSHAGCKIERSKSEDWLDRLDR
jgi:hypothetical protein